jgi:CBS domain containing-hemolysin-like protein
VSPLWIALLIASIVLTFVSSLPRREPIRLPGRLAGDQEEEEVRHLRRSLVVQIGLASGGVVCILAAEELSPVRLVLFILLLLLARLLGERVGQVRRSFATILAPLMAPIDGAALLVEWMISPVFRRMRGEATLETPSETAYNHVLELTQTTVESVMTPRSEVDWFRANAPLSEITDSVKRKPHAYYPVFEGDFERLVGMISLIDLLEPASRDATAADLARHAVMVPETIGCDDLLERMRTDRFDTAVVVDEFGGIAGLVTLEDLLEVLVGEMIGEHEAVPVRARRLTEGNYLVDATVRIDEFEDLFGVTLPEGDYETLAGLFLSHVVRIPTPGEKLKVGGIRLEIVRADAHRIRTIKVTFPTTTELAESSAGRPRRDVDRSV